MSPHFVEAVEAISQFRSQGRFPFFKMVLNTNASLLDRPQVQNGLSLFTLKDEIWVKLDAGTQDYMNRVNRPNCTIEKIVSNIRQLARQRPVVIQSLFPVVNGKLPATFEIESYVQRLVTLKEDGARISLVQIYSASHPACHPECTHMNLKQLHGIAKRVDEVTGLEVEVF